MRAIGPILVIAEQPVIAALVGLLVELTGSQPVFANPGEQPSDAVQRLRPLAVILIDVGLDAARSDLFFAMASRKGIGVAVFGAPERTREIAEVAGGRAISWFTLPPNVGRVEMALALAAGQPATRRGEERRRQPEAEETPDGTRILTDAEGHCWMVYDRRSTRDRRERLAAGAFDRVFVGERGEQLCYSPNSEETADRSAPALERQLARAVPL